MATNTKEDQLTTRSKSLLGWGDDNKPEYQKWARHMKAYALIKNITGRRGASDTEWGAYRQYGMRAHSGLPASGGRMLNLTRGDKDGEKARERFPYLLLDFVKKDRETMMKGGLASAAIKRKHAVNDSDDDESAPLRLNYKQTEAIRVLLIDPDKPMDLVGASGQFKWATAGTKQLVALKELTIAALMNAINTRIPAAKYVRSILCAVTKPPANGAEPEDIERITCDEDLRNFIEVTCGAYKPITMQVQLNRTNPAVQTPPLNVGTSGIMSSLQRSLMTPMTPWHPILRMNFN